jgi:hypothetical protein
MSISTETGDQIGSVTRLEDILQVPWAADFELGRGVDIVTGSVHQTVLNDIQVAPAPEEFSDETTFGFISSKEDFEREIGVAVSGSYNFDGVTLSGSASYTNKVQFSKTSSTLIAKYSGTYRDYDRITKPALTPDAAKAIQDYEEFQALQGDYFISGGRKEFSFIAVFVLKASDESSLNKFHVEMGAKAPEVFDAKVSADFMAKASQHNIDVSAHIFMSDHANRTPEPSGHQGKLTPAMVLDALDWFKANKTGTYATAELVHFSTLDKDFPRARFVGSDFFAKVEKLNRAVVELDRLHANCPPSWRARIEDGYQKFKTELRGDRLVFAERPQVLDETLAACAALSSDIATIIDRRNFLRDLNTIVGTSKWPGSGNSAISPRLPQIANPAAIQIRTDTYDHKETYTFGDTTLDYTFRWSAPDRLLCGIDIIPNWHDNNGSWEIQSGSPLSSAAAIKVTSEFARGYSWSCRFHSIPATDFQFTDEDLQG